MKKNLFKQSYIFIIMFCVIDVILHRSTLAMTTRKLAPTIKKFASSATEINLVSAFSGLKNFQYSPQILNSTQKYNSRYQLARNNYQFQPTQPQQRNLSTSSSFNSNKVIDFNEIPNLEQATNFLAEQLQNVQLVKIGNGILDTNLSDIKGFLKPLANQASYKDLLDIVNNARAIQINFLNNPRSWSLKYDAITDAIKITKQTFFLRNFLDENTVNISSLAKFLDTYKEISYKELFSKAQQLAQQDNIKNVSQKYFDQTMSSIATEQYALHSSRTKEQIENALLKNGIPKEGVNDINIPMLNHFVSTNLRINDINQFIEDSQSLAKKHNENFSNKHIYQTFTNNQYKINPIFIPQEQKPTIRQHWKKTCNDEYNPTIEIPIHYEKGKLYSTAIHESGHALSVIYNRMNSNVFHLTIEPRTGILSSIVLGSVKPILTYPNITLKNEEQINDIITLLSGTVAEQIFDVYRQGNYSDTMLTDTNEICNFLSERPGIVDQPQELNENLWLINYATRENTNNNDLQKAIARAQKIIFKDDLSPKQIEKMTKELIADCYKKAYVFISQHKNQVKDLSNAVLQKGSLDENDIYNIVKAPRPLYAFEHGPLPEMYTDDYQRRV